MDEPQIYSFLAVKDADGKPCLALFDQEELAVNPKLATDRAERQTAFDSWPESRKDSPHAAV